MSALVADPAETTAPPEAFELRESAVPLARDAVEMPTELIEAFSEEARAKMVPLHIIRPGLGKGRGRHLYEAKMLEENAHKFRGWKMYVDHLSPEARRAAGGLPRSVRDLGGRVVESYWDPNVPADPVAGHGAGAVIGWAIPTPFVRELIVNDPEIVEASISSNATGVHPVRVAGQRAWCVEGIEDRGSVDWVTEAGAGGRVVALMESTYTEEDMGLLESMTDEEFIAYVREQRPHLVEESTATPSADADDKNQRAEAGSGSAETPGEDMALTPQALQEALQDDGFRDLFHRLIDDRATEIAEGKLAELAESMKTELETAHRTALEEALDAERDVIRAEANATAHRGIELRDLRDHAHALVEAARLPKAFAEQVRTRFTLDEAGAPTDALDVVDDVDDDGNVTKTSRAKLTEAVETAIQEQRSLLASANPTRVKGAGAASGDGTAETKKGEGTLWGAVLQEAGLDPETTYASA